MSPMDLDSIDFKSNDAEDTNIISKAYENIINANGGIVLNQNKITNDLYIIYTAKIIKKNK